MRNIANALAAAQPESKDYFVSRAKAYQQELLALDEQTRTKFSAIPRDKRKIITNHDALSYYAAAYGITILSATGVSTEGQPTAQNIAALTDQIKQENIKALFIESMADPRQMETIARDTGARLGGTLYTDALSPPHGEAPTYLDMMKVNGERILAGVR
ncbi:MAG TPA: hypothetical protein DCY07_00515 [Rhodospirillaceae bacterium]|nr:hypothetical protein [Rhodospirillaceae bacterium]